MARTKRYSLERMELPDLEAIPNTVRRKAMRQAVKPVAQRARKEAPVGPRRGPGKLAKTIRYSVRKGGRVGVVKAMARHAHLVHDGTKPHEIRSRHGKMMAMRIGGRMVMARAVHHPGARANPFMTRALERSLPEVEAALRAAGEEGIEEALR